MTGEDRRAPPTRRRDLTFIAVDRNVGGRDGCPNPRNSAHIGSHRSVAKRINGGSAARNDSASTIGDVGIPTRKNSDVRAASVYESVIAEDCDVALSSDRRHIAGY